MTDYLKELGNLGSGGSKGNPLGLNITPSADVVPATTPFSWKKFSNFMAGEIDPTTGAQKTQGFAVPALSALAGIGNTYLGMKQFGLAEDAFKFQKKAWERDFAVQKNLVNSEMSDRQNARLAANPGAYASEAEYMKKYGVK